MIQLIYCADGNKRFAQIAIEAGFRYGSRLPHRGLHFPIWFADQDWRQPDRAAYVEALRQYRPSMATVLDWEESGQLPEVLDWAEEVAAIVDIVLVIPKVIGGIDLLPREIGGKPVRLGYSVPTGYGGTQLPLWEFGDREVHLLGGTPQKQMELVHYLNVASADGNVAQKMAIKFCSAWVPGTAPKSPSRWWLRLETHEGEKDVPYRAFEESCVNVMSAWNELYGGQDATSL